MHLDFLTVKTIQNLAKIVIMPIVIFLQACGEFVSSFRFDQCQHITIIEIQENFMRERLIGLEIQLETEIQFQRVWLTLTRTFFCSNYSETIFHFPDVIPEDSATGFALILTVQVVSVSSDRQS